MWNFTFYILTGIHVELYILYFNRNTCGTFSSNSFRFELSTLQELRWVSVFSVLCVMIDI